MITVYGDTQSGNCYKVKLALEQTRAEYRWHHVDIMAGESRSETFLAKNPNGKVPTIELENGHCLAESNAILWYLSADTPLRPVGKFAETELLRWMFFEQYSHETYIATSRYWLKYCGGGPEYHQHLKDKQSGGYSALKILQQHLDQHNFLVDDSYSIADIALYAYTHVAHEGGFKLDEFPAIRRWLSRVRAQPNYVAIG